MDDLGNPFDIYVTVNTSDRLALVHYSNKPWKNILFCLVAEKRILNYPKMFNNLTKFLMYIKKEILLKKIIERNI